MNRSKEEIAFELQKVVEQMRLDDINENPDCAYEYFCCDACGNTAPLAGSMIYDKYRLCNDCVLIAEIGLELKQFTKIEELIDKMEDKRLEADCEFLRHEQSRLDN